MNDSRKKAVLIYPPTGLYDRSDRCQSYLESETGQLISPPMDLAYMAAVLEKAGYHCFVRDYPVEKKGWPDLERDLERERPSLLAVSTTLSTLSDDLRACDIAKRIDSGCLTVGKGGYVGDESESILRMNPRLDIFINYEPEFVMDDIARSRPLDSIKGISFRRGEEIVNNPPRPFDGDLDTLPMPARHLIKNEFYKMPDTRETFTTIFTGRGCPFRCIFCLAGKVGGKALRLRSPSHVIAELEECIRSFRIRNFWIRADTFTFNKKWVLEICRLMIEKKFSIRWMTNSRVDMVDDEMLGLMKRSGCTVIGFGVESGSQDLLDKMKKGITLSQTKDAVAMCRRHGIKTYLNFVIGLPWESEDTFHETIRFAKSLPADMYNFSLSYPFPGTELYEYAKQNGLLRSDDALARVYGFFEPVADTLYMKKDRLAQLKAIAFRSVMLDPRFILRTISATRSPALLVSYLQEAIRLFRVTHGVSRMQEASRGRR